MSETENGQEVQSYIVCAECGEAFLVPTDEVNDVDINDTWCQDCIDMAEPNGDEGYFDNERYDDIDFADPGGRSALRAETPDNPRNLPCGNCGGENLLTPMDKALGLQCNRCADVVERGGY